MQYLFCLLYLFFEKGEVEFYLYLSTCHSQNPTAKY